MRSIIPAFCFLLAAYTTTAAESNPARSAASVTADLSDMAVPGCFSECSVIGTIGGALALAIKDAYGHTTIDFIDDASLPRGRNVRNLPSFDREFLETVDTSDCVSDCVVTLIVDHRFTLVYRDAAGGGLVHVSENDLPFRSEALASSAADEECKHTYVHTLLNCGCIADKKAPGRLIMKVVYLVEEFDCTGQLVDFYHHVDEISYSASSGCLCRYLGFPD